MKKIVSVIGLFALSACASVIDGTHQKVTINTTPQGADCTLNRKNEKEGAESVIARVNPTPGEVTIEKTKYDINVVCNKPGYQSTTFTNRSGSAGATLGNIILGGPIGWAVDSARGADNKYDSPITIPLIRDESTIIQSQPQTMTTGQPTGQ
jgi:hypothetical protein